METLVEDTENWKQKYDECSARLQLLESISKDVLKEYYEVKKKFEEILQQNEKLQKNVLDTNSQMKEVNGLIGPAVQQYTKLKSKYEIEKECRTEAQTYAAKVAQQNMKLKRQSMDILASLNQTTGIVSIVDLKFDDEEEIKIDNSYQESLNATINELKHEIAESQANLIKVQDELNLEKANSKWTSHAHQSLKLQHKQTEASLKQYREAMNELSKVSQEAYDQYKRLQEKCGSEDKSKSVIEQNVDEINTLPSTITTSSAESDSLVGKNGASVCEKTQLQKQIQESEDKYNVLQEKYSLLEQKYEELRRPPPAPPLPPPQKSSTSIGVSNKASVSKTSKTPSVNNNVKPDFIKELEITFKHGIPRKDASMRKPRRKMSLDTGMPRENPIAELRNFANKIRWNRSGSESDLLPTKVTGESKFATALRRIKKQEGTEILAELPQKATISDGTDEAKVEEQKMVMKINVQENTEQTQERESQTFQNYTTNSRVTFTGGGADDD